MGPCQGFATNLLGRAARGFRGIQRHPATHALRDARAPALRWYLQQTTQIAPGAWQSAWMTPSWPAASHPRRMRRTRQGPLDPWRVPTSGPSHTQAGSPLVAGPAVQDESQVSTCVRRDRRRLLGTAARWRAHLGLLTGHPGTSRPGSHSIAFTKCTGTSPKREGRGPYGTPRPPPARAELDRRRLPSHV